MKAGTMYSSAQAAEQVGTDARTLRVFLRASKTWNNPGSAGRYTFTDADIPALSKEFVSWATKHKAHVTKPRNHTTVRPTPKPKPAPIAEDIAWPLPIPPRLVGDARIDAEQRVTRLENALRARGLHVSQSRDERFAPLMAEAS